MNDIEPIENCYLQMYRGMVEKDRAILSEMLDDSFVLVHMTGMHQTKEAFIRAIEDGTLNYFFADHQQIRADIRDETAEMVGQSVVHAAVFGGRPHTWHLQLNLNLVRTGKFWRITEAKASTY